MSVPSVVCVSGRFTLRKRMPLNITEEVTTAGGNSVAESTNNPNLHPENTCYRDFSQTQNSPHPNPKDWIAKCSRILSSVTKQNTAKLN